MVRLLWMAALATAMLLADAGPTPAQAPPPAGRVSGPAIPGLGRVSPRGQGNPPPSRRRGARPAGRGGSRPPCCATSTC